MIMKTAPNVSLFMSNPNQVMILNRKEWTVKFFRLRKIQIIKISNIINT